MSQRPRPPRPDVLPTLAQPRDELRARLPAHRMDNAAQVMRHLVFVHHTLRRSGRPAVERLPAALLARAGVQAEMLTGDEPSAPLTLPVSRLRVLHAAAELREERALTQTAPAPGAAPGVSEATQEAFDAAERGWVDTVSPLPAAVLPDGDA